MFPDAMHMVKDAVEHVFNVMVGKEDSMKVRQAEADLGRFEASPAGHGSVPVASRKRKKTSKVRALPLRRIA